MRRAVRAKPTVAQKYRAHRRAFKLALRLGVTPKEAQTVIDRSSARKRMREMDRRLRAMRHSTIVRDDKPWLMRDLDT